MDVVTALMDKIKRRYSTDYKPEVIDNEDEALDGARFG